MKSLSGAEYDDNSLLRGDSRKGLLAFLIVTDLAKRLRRLERGADLR